jgi:anthranilate synthase component II
LKILLIDNYDSYTYNIVNTLAPLHDGVLHLLKNDQVSPDLANTYDKIIISPGPDIPQKSGNIIEVIKQLAPHISLLGICLGHQAIAEAFGAQLFQMDKPQHGSATSLKHTHVSKLYINIPDDAHYGLYHSWAVDAGSLPAELSITSTSPSGVMMSLEHKSLPIYGVQFHPESYLSTHGAQLIANWLELC